MYKTDNICAIAYHLVPKATLKITSNGKSFHYQAQKRAAAEEAEKRKKEEIKALQGQLAALKEMQAGVQVGRGLCFPPSCSWSKSCEQLFPYLDEQRAWSAFLGIL